MSSHSYCNDFILCNYMYNYTYKVILDSIHYMHRVHAGSHSEGVEIFSNIATNRYFDIDVSTGTIMTLSDPIENFQYLI